MIVAALLAACTDPGSIRAKPGEVLVAAGDSDGADSPAETGGAGGGGGGAGGGGDTGPVVQTYPDQRVGIFYLAWHTYAALAWADRGGADPRTVEDVIREGGSFADLVYDAGLYGEAQGFHYHQEPTLGFYCLYRPRDDEAGLVSTCPDISATAEAHATELWDAGIDFVYVDLTNLPTYSDFGDVLGLRPLEVLLEEWGDLRRRGVPTPQIAAWVPFPTLTDGSEPMLSRVLDAYDAADDDVVLTIDGQRVIFGVGASLDPTLADEARSRGVLPVPMWGDLDDATLAGGTAGWMQPCRSGDAFTTLVDPATPCNQGYTTTSPLGTVLSVSRSFQVGYSSLPFQSSGRLGGLTFQKQMETAFSVQPDVLIVNAWNEHLAQPQANPYDTSYGGLRQSMGVTGGTDATADWLWVDMYGSDLNRDFEPTVQDGGAGFSLLQSCLRVWRTGARSCTDTSETCCQLAEGRTTIYSVRASSSPTSGDHVPTPDRSEVDGLVASGWTEACTPFYGPPGLCADGSGDGPFQLYPNGGDGRVGVYRCYTGVDHFVSTDSGCEGTTPERLLGYAATTPSSDMPRPLHRCYNSGETHHLHWLDAACPSGVTNEAILGYVR